MLVPSAANPHGRYLLYAAPCSISFHVKYIRSSEQMKSLGCGDILQVAVTLSGETFRQRTTSEAPHEGGCQPSQGVPRYHAPTFCVSVDGRDVGG